VLIEKYVLDMGSPRSEDYHADMMMEVWRKCWVIIVTASNPIDHLPPTVMVKS
jgi:hypothetical protein